MTGAELKAARETLGLTGEAFARLFGIPNARALRAMETGRRNGAPAYVPETLALLVCASIKLPDVREFLEDFARERG